VTQKTQTLFIDDLDGSEAEGTIASSSTAPTMRSTWTPSMPRCCGMHQHAMCVRPGGPGAAPGGPPEAGAGHWRVGRAAPTVREWGQGAGHRSEGPNRRRV